MGLGNLFINGCSLCISFALAFAFIVWQIIYSRAPTPSSPQHLVCVLISRINSKSTYSMAYQMLTHRMKAGGLKIKRISKASHNAASCEISCLLAEGVISVIPGHAAHSRQEVSWFTHYKSSEHIRPSCGQFSIGHTSSGVRHLSLFCLDNGNRVGSRTVLKRI